MKICFATSECVPFVKTGGLADVGGALPKALSEQGCDVKIFLPLYGSINKLEHDLRLVEEFRDIPQHMGTKLVTFDTWTGRLPDSDVQVYFVDCPEYYHRSKIYTEEPDEDERFILFQRAVFKILQRQQWAPDVVHCNDWEAALLPVYLNTNYKGESLFTNTATLLAIHNIGYQGIFPKESILKAGLSSDHYYPTGPYEFYGSFCFLKAGIVFSDIISTVSETYALEIQSSAYGAGLEGVLASRSSDLYGILNGIDTNTWSPKTDQIIPHNFSIKNLSVKKKNKQALLEYTSLPFDENIPTIGMISRLAEQKGFELLQPILKDLMRLPLQLVVLGSGEKKYEDFLRKAAKTYPDKCSVYIGFNNELAHLITAGCDMFLMPSRYEPCGLNQMYSLNYGTVPIVRKTGGLADTVQDFHENERKGTGFAFEGFTSEALHLCIKRALDVFKNKNVWREIMKRGMRADFSWDASAKRYIELYEKAIAKHSGVGVP